MQKKVFDAHLFGFGIINYYCVDLTSFLIVLSFTHFSNYFFYLTHELNSIQMHYESRFHNPNVAIWKFCKQFIQWLIPHVLFSRTVKIHVCVLECQRKRQVLFLSHMTQTLRSFSFSCWVLPT